MIQGLASKAREHWAHCPSQCIVIDARWYKPLLAVLRTCASAWAFGFNRPFGSVFSVFQNFGFQKMTPDRFAKIPKTDQFRFGFLIRFFG